MNSNALWGIIGILVAIVIYLLQRKKHYAGRICFSVMDAYKIMSAPKDNYKDLSLKYQEFEIEEDVSYIKFVLYNDKSFDYSNEDRNDPIRITLPDNHKWIDAKVVDHSNNVQPEVFICKTQEQELDLIFKLLKGGEFIKIDGLIESKSEENIKKLQDSMQIKHRISNVALTKKTDFLSLAEYRHSVREVFFIGSIFTILLLLIIFFVFGHPASPLQYEDLRTGKTGSLYLNNEGRVVINKGNFIWNGYSEPVDQNEFTNVFKPSFENKGKAFPNIFYWCWIFVIVFIFGFLIHTDVIPLLRTKKLRKIMQKENAS